MPTYEYRCLDCDEDFEIDLHIHERDEKAACPHCGSRLLEPIITKDFLSPRPE